MRDLPLRQLRAFAALYECGGVRPAGRLLGIAHSAVSRHVHELEQWIGVPLLAENPGARSMAFTSQGEALGKVLDKSFNDMSQAILRLRERRSGNSVTLATTPSLATRWVLPRLPELQQRAPWVELSITVDQKVRDPAEEGADLSLRMGSGPWEGFDCSPLMDEQLFPVVGRKKWESDGRPTTADYLNRTPLLHDRDPNTSWGEWKARFGPADLDVRKGPRFTSSDMVLRAAAEGVGVALARGHLAADDLRSGVLVRPFGNDSIRLENAYWLVRPGMERERSAVAAVEQWLRGEAEKAAEELLAS